MAQKKEQQPEKLTAKTLEDGKVLRFLKERFLAVRSEETLLPVLHCLRDSVVVVPVMAELGKNDAQQMQQVKEGDTVTLQEQIRMKPDVLRDGAGRLFYPIFSQREQMPEEYRAKFSTLTMPAMDCLNMAHQMEGLEGLVLDPFTQSLSLPFTVSDFMYRLPSRLEEEEQA